MGKIKTNQNEPNQNSETAGNWMQTRKQKISNNPKTAECCKKYWKERNLLFCYKWKPKMERVGTVGNIEFV